MPDDLLAAWARTDKERAVSHADRELGDGLAAARECIIDNLAGVDRDRYSACALLGRLIAARGGSASFASSEIDALASALPSADPTFLRAARASLMEGFAAEILERAQAEEKAAWEPPWCVVLLPDDRAAVAAGFPSDDGEALASWADRVSASLVRARVKKVAVSGRGPAKAALREALGLVGLLVEER
jgi:hypothetical protein